MSSTKPTCIWYSKTGISSFPGGPNCLLTAEYLKITTNKTYNVHLPNMLIFVCTVTLHLCKRKFFWLHNIEIIWFFKDLHTSVLLLQQHHSVKKYLLQIPDSKSSHTQPILQPGHFYLRFCAAQRIWYQIYWICGKSGNIFYSVNCFFWLNYAASKQVL